MKTLMFIILFLLVGGFFIISNENIRLDSQENVDLFLDLYTDWLGGLVDNSGVILGYVVKMEWLPDQNVSVELK